VRQRTVCRSGEAKNQGVADQPNGQCGVALGWLGLLMPSVTEYIDPVIPP
jgi:hypothetical protein